MKRLLLLLFVCVSCLDPYNPPASADSLNALVVDGYVDINGNASVTLMRSIPLNGYTPQPIEPGAVVEIETSEGERTQLHEDDKATYTASGLSVNYSSTYQLNIETSNGRRYQSDPVRVYKTPEIDSIYFTISRDFDEVELRINAHDTNPEALGYYVVDGIETYEYHANAVSNFKLVNHKAVRRTPDEQVYFCWRDLTASPTVIDTHSLSDKVLNGLKVYTINHDDVKLKIRYSDLVTIRAIGEQEYTYMDQLIKSTQQQASLYAVSPGPVLGNVHSIDDPHEYVLGYFTARELKAQRVFIERGDLPGGFTIVQPSSECMTQASCLAVEDGSSPTSCIAINDLANVAITDVLFDSRGNDSQYIYVNLECGDCRTLGGYTKKPSFW
ncbi:MAG: DUF4249 domain-containing protein [Bacteroidota bacterium]